MTRIESIVLAVAVFFFACHLVAEESAHNPDNAKKLFEQGVEQFKTGDIEAAAESFRSAHGMHPHWKIFFNIGQCEALLKRYGLALEAFESYLVGGGDEIPTERQAEVQREVARRLALGSLPPAVEEELKGVQARLGE